MALSRAPRSSLRVPARACGHAQGDILLGLNGQLVMGRSVDELRPYILGPTGTQIELLIQRGTCEREVGIC